MFQVAPSLMPPFHRVPHVPLSESMHPTRPFRTSLCARALSACAVQEELSKSARENVEIKDESTRLQAQWVDESAVFDMMKQHVRCLLPPY